jgi:hypothetical protein
VIENIQYFLYFFSFIGLTFYIYYMLYKNNLFRFVKLFNYLVFSVFYKKPYNIIFISIFASKKELINTISSLFLDHCLYFIFIIIYKFHRSWYSCFIINSCSIIFCQIFNWCNSPCMKNCILYSICNCCCRFFVYFR